MNTIFNSYLKFNCTSEGIKVYYSNIYDFNLPETLKQNFLKEIIQDYKIHGAKVLKKIPHDSVFVLFDSKNKILLIKNDSVGHFTIYYCKTKDKFNFGDNLKQIAHETDNEIDLLNLKHFLVLGYIPGNQTIFKGIFKIPPATLFIHKNDKTLLKSYNTSLLKINHTEMYYVNELQRRLMQVIEEYATKDLGVMVSGGVDSMILLALAKKIKKSIKTYILGIDACHHDLFKNFREIAKYFNTDHYEIKIDSGSYFQNFQRSIELLDEPIYDIYQVIPRIFLSQIMKKDMFLLCGSGADDLFCGEPRFLISHFRLLSKMGNPMPTKTTLKNVMRTVFENRTPGKLSLQNTINKDYCAKIVYPYMHRPVVELANVLPPSLIIKNNQNKYFLRKFAQRLLPQRWAYKRKATTLVPDVFKKIIVDSYYPFVENSDYLKAALGKATIQTDDISIKLKLIIFQLWYNKIKK